MQRKHFTIWDVLIATVIMLGPALLTSSYLFLNTNGTAFHENMQFTSIDNQKAFLIQSFQLILMFAYIKLRNFDYSGWQYKVSFKATFLSILLFLLLGELIDIVSFYYYGGEWFSWWIHNKIFFDAFSHISFSLITFSILNGFYEEFFFLGICISTSVKYKSLYFIYAVLMRVLVHTYQGTFNALSIGLILGVIYYFLYTKKSSNLYLYTLSHSLADIFGLSIIHFL